MTRRIAVNLVLFALAGVLLAYWAVTTVISIDALDRPFKVTADFTTSPGLSPHFEVTYLGQRVGSIRSVELEGDHVLVTMAIDRDRRDDLPRAVDATVRRKSVVGEPYVDLSPSPSTDPRRGARLSGGDHIGLERTRTPLAYSELFAAAARLVAAVDPSDLQTLVHELAVGLSGRGQSIRDLLVDADDLTRDLVAHGDELDALVRDIADLAGTFAEHRGAVAASIDQVAVLADTLAKSRRELDALLAEGPTFGEALADVVSKSKASLGCTLDALGVVGTKLDRETVAALVDVIALSPRFAYVLEGIDAQADGTGGYLFLNHGTQRGQVPVYDEQRPLPEVPPLPSCGEVAPAAPGGPGALGTAPAGASAAPAGPSPLTPRPGDPGAADEPPTVSSTKDLGGNGVGGMLVVVGLVLVLLIAAAVIGRRMMAR
jgi:phospholipid/cholesterol/gamma-HCH transport system substrate-binding protein